MLSRLSVFFSTLFFGPYPLFKAIRYLEHVSLVGVRDNEHVYLFYLLYYLITHNCFSSLQHQTPILLASLKISVTPEARKTTGITSKYLTRDWPEHTNGPIGRAGNGLCTQLKNRTRWELGRIVRITKRDILLLFLLLTVSEGLMMNFTQEKVNWIVSKFR